MKFFILLVIAFGVCSALPAKRSTVLDLLKDVEEVLEEDAKVLLSKFITVVHHVESSVQYVKEIVPKAQDKIHEEIDTILNGLKSVVKEIEMIIERKSVLYSFDLLNELTELSGGTQIGTVLKFMALADKAHKVMEDAKQFVPNAEKTLNKMQATVETHVKDFASHVVKELGLQDFLAYSMMDKIENVYNIVKKEGHKLVVDLLHKIEQAFITMEEKLPEEFSKVEEAVEEIRTLSHEILGEIEDSILARKYSVLDFAGEMSSGTSLGTAIKIMNVVDKFNKVVQDVREFGPKSEKFLEHSIDKVADSAQKFFTHAANELLKL